MEFNSPLGRRLQLCLEASGHTKADLARACRVKPSSVSEWFSGESKSMRGPTLLRAAEFFGVNALWLGTGEGPQRPATMPPTLTGSNVPHRVAERERGDAWPFHNITAARWFALPASDRQRIETFAEATLQAWEHRNPNQTYGTTG